MPSTAGRRRDVGDERDRTPVDRPPHEPSKTDVCGAAIATPRPAPHAGFDADLNPVDDEFINTHGSER